MTSGNPIPLRKNRLLKNKEKLLNNGNNLPIGKAVSPVAFLLKWRRYRLTASLGRYLGWLA
ncbi:MAG: hypothetical protein SVU24_09380 [Pseudomonadota bacterium]|nr:hypothetical protein [Pseudomonadota bacterium]